MKVSCSLGIAAAALAMSLASAAPAMADAMTGYYYILSADNPDVENGIDGGIVPGLVENSLGPDGQPVASALALSYGGGSGPISDINGSNEILWWTPHAGIVTYEKTQIDTLPLLFTSNFYPDGAGGNGGANGYRAVHWTGTFDLGAGGGTVSLSLGADDDAWVFIDGILADDAGGVHALSSAPFTSASLTAGDHTIDIFFADRHTVQSGIDFEPRFEINPVDAPEPATLAILGAGLAGIGALRRRKRS